MRPSSVLSLAGFVFAMLLCAGIVSAQAPVHSVTGSGGVTDGPVSFRQTLAVHQDAAGRVWGVSIVNLDLTAFDLGRITFRVQPTCLDVAGNSAWIGGVVTHSTNGAIVGLGENVIALVQDLGGNGEDILHGELFPPDTLCTDRPALSETVVKNGNFNVR